MRFQAKNSEFHLSPMELRKLIAASRSKRDRLLVELFVYTGLRRAELRSLRWADVDINRRRLIIRFGKGGKQRIVYLPETVAQDLAGYRGNKGLTDHIFQGRIGGAMTLRNINYIVERVGHQAGVVNPNPRYRSVGPHLLRHSFARNWKRAGGSLESLQKILGHSSLKTTLDIYGTESQQETEANYQQLVAALF